MTQSRTPSEPVPTSAAFHDRGEEMQSPPTTSSSPSSVDSSPRSVDSLTQENESELPAPDYVDDDEDKVSSSNEDLRNECSSNTDMTDPCSPKVTKLKQGFFCKLVSQDPAPLLPSTRTAAKPSELSVEDQLASRLRDANLHYSKGQYNHALNGYLSVARRFFDVPTLFMISQMILLGKGCPADPLLALPYIRAACVFCNNSNLLPSYLLQLEITQRAYLGRQAYLQQLEKTQRTYLGRRAAVASAAHADLEVSRTLERLKQFAETLADLKGQIYLRCGISAQRLLLAGETCLSLYQMQLEDGPCQQPDETHKLLRQACAYFEEAYKAATEYAGINALLEGEGSKVGKHASVVTKQIAVNLGKTAKLLLKFAPDEQLERDKAVIVEIYQKLNIQPPLDHVPTADRAAMPPSINHVPAPDRGTTPQFGRR